MGRLSRSVLVFAIAGLLLAGGGAYALASSLTKGQIRVCVHHKGGTLYKARKCAKHDSKLIWNKRGVAGPRGTTGAAGAPGSTGPQGPPRPITGTLPQGVTLRGFFSMADYASTASTELKWQPISFGWQLASAPSVHLVTGTVPTGCSGSVSNPGADPGNLCIFTYAYVGTLVEFNPLTGNQNQATTFGGVLQLASPGVVGGYFADGTWAVTGS